MHETYGILPQIISGGDLIFFFCTKVGRLFEGRRINEGDGYFKQCSLEVVPYIYCVLLSINQKTITSNTLNMHGFFKCFKFGSLINFQSVNILSDRA